MPFRDPSQPSDFPFDEYAHNKSKAHAAKKRALWASVLKLLTAIDLVERCGFCRHTLTGLVVLIGELLDQPGTLARAREVGLAEAAGYVPVTPEPLVEAMQVTTTHEPHGELSERLVADRFARMTAPGVTPIIWLGRGVLAEWKVFQGTDVRIGKCDLPGGLVTGVPTAGGDSAARGDTTAGARTGGEVGDARGAAGEAAKAAEGAVPAGGRRPYRMAKVARPDRPGWQLYTATALEREQLMREVVAQQGPVDLDSAIEAVRVSLKLSAIRKATRGKLKSTLDELVKGKDVIVLPGDFYHLAGAPILPRDRSGCDERVRKLSALPPAEIDAALQEDLAEFGSRPQSEVIVGAAARLGHHLRRRASYPALAELMVARITALVEDPNGGLTRIGELLALTAPPATPAREAEVVGDGDEPGRRDDRLDERQEDEASDSAASPGTGTPSAKGEAARDEEDRDEPPRKEAA